VIEFLSKMCQSSTKVVVPYLKWELSKIGNKNGLKNKVMPHLKGNKEIIMEIIVTNKEKRQSYKKVSDNKLGETRLNTFGSKMWIIEYVTATNITVQFLCGYITKTTYSVFLNGNVKNPYDASVYGHGFLGQGKYTANIDGVRTLEYETWKAMLQRCYSIPFQKKQPTYIGCIIDEKWHNFQIFSKWFDENYYKIKGEVMALDKDILYKHNKIYSPNTSIFVPMNINSLFIKSDILRGDLPIGVSTNNNGGYRARCRDNKGKQHHIGTYSTKKDCFKAYKKYKETVIKEVADSYKNEIPTKLYEAMYKYEVEIID
jgi:hypothetical protein